MILNPPETRKRQVNSGALKFATASAIPNWVLALLPDAPYSVAIAYRA